MVEMITVMSLNDCLLRARGQCARHSVMFMVEGRWLAGCREEGAEKEICQKQ